MIKAILLTSCFAFATLSAETNLITNGSFESPIIAVSGLQDFAEGSTGIPGWTVVGGPQVSVVGGGYANECCVFPAQDGTQWLDLTGNGSNRVEGVEQAVNTISGMGYKLTFWVGNTYDPGGIYGTLSDVTVYLGGLEDPQPEGDFLNQSTALGVLTWQLGGTIYFRASSNRTILDFLNTDPSSDNSNGLDNVVLVPYPSTVTPEPSPMLLLGGSLVLVALVGRVWNDRHLRDAHHS